MQPFLCSFEPLLPEDIEGLIQQQNIPHCYTIGIVSESYKHALFTYYRYSNNNNHELNQEVVVKLKVIIYLGHLIWHNACNSFLIGCQRGYVMLLIFEIILIEESHTSINSQML